MSGGWSEVFEPGLRLWHEEQRRQQDDRHEIVAGAPPGEQFLRDAVLVLPKPVTKASPASGAAPSAPSQDDSLEESD